ncbi:MAG: ACT domain-containing protein [Kiritimatiellae bacterium]|nr:ACT domain-containing protein [Kiritimatiellia bacterium]
MKIKQISVFLENRSGRLAGVLGILAGVGANIRALSLADTNDFGILRLIVDKTDEALAALKEKNFTVRSTDVLAVEVPDRPGGLQSILQVLSTADVNVEYMYAFVTRKTEKAVVIFRFEDADEALAALKAAGVSVLDADTVHELCAMG